MSVKFTVLQVIPDFNSGGVERGTLEVASYLKKRRVNNLVCSNGGSLVANLKELGIKHIKLPVNSKNPIVMLLNVYRIAKIIRKNEVDIIHARSRAPAWSCYIASLITKCKFVTTFHGAYSATHPLKRFYNSVMLKGKRVIAVSNYIKKHIETKYRFTSQNLVVIDRGADLEYFNPTAVDEARIKAIKHELDLELDIGEKLIVLPSRFTRLKGHLYLLKALKYLNFKKYKCLIIGKASEAQSEYILEIEKAIKANKLGSNVIIRTQPTSDMPALYAIADLVVSSSIEPEGFGRTIVEAQAMHKIVVSTNIGAPSDIIEDGISGFLVPTSDAATFAEVLDKVLNIKPEEARKITKYAAKLVADKYSLELMCKKTLEVYRSLIEDEEDELSESDAE